MAPKPGDVHRRPRRDSRAVALWDWIKSRRAPWTATDAAEAAKLSPRRAREIISALHVVGAVKCVEAAVQSGQFESALWAVKRHHGLLMIGAPILIISKSQRVVGIRFE